MFYISKKVMGIESISKQEGPNRTNFEDIERSLKGMSGGEALSKEALGYLVPESVYTVAKNSDAIEIRQMRGPELSFIVIEHDFDEELSSEQDFYAWRDEFQRKKKELGLEKKSFRVLPEPPSSVHRLHARYATEIELGALALTDRILLAVKMHSADHGKSVTVDSFDGEKGGGIATEFYGNTLPNVLRKTEFKYIVGDNNITNIKFFTDVLGRSLIRDLNTLGKRELSGADVSHSSPYSTVQFLYPEDKERLTSKPSAT